jgi:hypothetical protein
LTKFNPCDIIKSSKGKKDNKMINIRTLKKVVENGGLTLKDGKVITYKSGWQVATEGKETTDIKEAMKMIKEYGGNCGVWLENGIYYIDKSKRVNTKKEALEIGKACNQISVLRWRDMGLVYC